MTTSSEDVLLLINNVRHQKKDGTLYIMAERIAWIMQSKDIFSVSHKYADIKTQKISPDGKAKVQLQVVLHDGNASTFQFTNPEGTESQLKDRNDVKDLLQQLLPKFKRRVNKELEEKNRMLAENPELLQLYRDLVTSQVVTAEEFWAEHAVNHQNKAKSKESQDVGVSGAFLADIKPQTDGCNGLKYNLTADIIHSIFKTYPAVKRKHLENVPNKMTESEFWTRFFQSHYFHRDIINSGNKDVFSECAKYDEQDIQQELRQASKDPLLDITTFVDSCLDEGYGLLSKDGSSNLPSGSNFISQGTLANRSLIRRFNHHSMMVLKVSLSEGKGSSDSIMKGGPLNHQQQSKPTINGDIQVKHKDREKIKLNGPKIPEVVPVEELDPEVKKARLQEKVTFDDLESQASTSGTRLQLTKKERYLHGPTQSSNSEYIDSEELLHSAERIKYDIERWNPSLTTILSSNTAVSVLQELSPGSALMKGNLVDDLSQLVPEDVREELRNLYGALCELLRHFWSCFPITTKSQQEKVLRVRASLERFQYAKLQPFHDRLLRDHLNSNLTEHMSIILDAAYNKFNMWQSKRMTLKL